MSTACRLTRSFSCLLLAWLLIGGPAWSQGPPQRAEGPSVDRLNVEDFERKPQPSRPKAQPRRAPEGSPPADPAEAKKPKPQEAKSAVPGQVRRESVTGLEFVWVPGGCFGMGSPPQETGRKNDEGPAHEVCEDGIWMGRTEVTNGAFLRFVEATGYRTDAEREGFAWGLKDRNLVKRPGDSWKQTGYEQTEGHPVVNVSWNDARAMVEWLSGRTGLTFRLPTEAEWEYGCRAGTQTARFWGDDPGLACLYANVADREHKKKFPEFLIHDCSDGFVFTAPAGRYQPNAFGLFDMLGNVSEWCEDPYAKDVYATHTRKNPQAAAHGPDRVIRGGGFRGKPDTVRCADRQKHDAAHRRGGLGFRLVLVDPSPG